MEIKTRDISALSKEEIIIELFKSSSTIFESTNERFDLLEERIKRLEAGIDKFLSFIDGEQSNGK